MKRKVRRGEHSCDIQKDRKRGQDRKEAGRVENGEIERRKKEAVNMGSIRERKATIKQFFFLEIHTHK